MGFFNKLFGKKETNNYTEKLATIILENFWTKDLEQAMALADTLVLNMGYIKAEEYILDACHRYGYTTAKVLEAIEGKKDTPKDAYYAVGSLLVNGADNLMKQLIDEIKTQYPNFNDVTYDDMSEKLMEYLCFNIQIKNGK